LNLPGSFTATTDGGILAITSGITNIGGQDFDDRFVSETVRTESGTLAKLINSVGRFKNVRLPDDSITLDLVFDQISGNLYASDFAKNIVYQVSSSGTLTNLIESGLNQPAYLAINGDNLYISDNGSGNILEFQLRTTPIPFEFNPASGIGILGGVWLVRKLIVRK
jgi:hypothetical protein